MTDKKSHPRAETTITHRRRDPHRLPLTSASGTVEKPLENTTAERE